MTTRVVNLRNPTTPFDVYIGRPSVWGNPYSFKSGTLAENQVADREAAIIAFRGYAGARLKDEPDWLKPLRDKVLGCFCKPLACHGDVLVALLESSHEHMPCWQGIEDDGQGCGPWCCPRCNDDLLKGL